MPPYHWWRTVFFLIPAISVYTIVLGAASIVSSLFDRRGYFAHRCARAWSWLILKTTGVDVTVEGLERITPGTTYVFVSNHQSIYDIPVIFASLPYQLRIIAKESLARFPVLGWHLKRGGHLFVDRRHPDRAGILKRWRALVSEGLSLIIFAEGTRSWDGRVARFKAGSFLLAIEAGLPVVPVAVIGTRAVMPKGRLRTEPARVALVVHDPIPRRRVDRADRARRQGVRRSRPRGRGRDGDREAVSARLIAPSPRRACGIVLAAVRDHQGHHVRVTAIIAAGGRGPAVRRRAAQAAADRRRPSDSRAQRRRSSSIIPTSTTSSWRCRPMWPPIRRRTCVPAEADPGRGRRRAASGFGGERVPGRRAKRATSSSSTTRRGRLRAPISSHARLPRRWRAARRWRRWPRATR